MEYYFVNFFYCNLFKDHDIGAYQIGDQPPGDPPHRRDHQPGVFRQDPPHRRDHQGRDHQPGEFQQHPVQLPDRQAQLGDLEQHRVASPHLPGHHLQVDPVVRQAPEEGNVPERQHVLEPHHDLEGDLDMGEEINGDDDFGHHAFQDFLNHEVQSMDGDELDEHEDYRTILSSLLQDWILCEISHTISKKASNSLWKIAQAHFYKLYSAKAAQGVKRKIPKLPQLRKKMYDDYTPEVKMEIGYISKATGEVEVVKDVQSTPVSRYPPSTHRRIYEIAYVDVSMLYYSITSVCFNLVLSSKVNHYLVFPSLFYYQPIKKKSLFNSTNQQPPT